MDYPDSKGALQDLKVCLGVVTSEGLRDNLAFRSACKGWINDRNWSWPYERRRNLLKSSVSSLTIIIASNTRRLLHPGADTKDILAQYVSIMRCLRFIDPPGVLLHKVADPIRKYLR